MAMNVSQQKARALGSYNLEDRDLPNNLRELRSSFYPSHASG